MSVFLYKKYILIVDSLEGYDEDSASFVDCGKKLCINYKTATTTKMIKDRIFTIIYGGASNNTNGYIYTLDGTGVSTSKLYTWFALDYFFYKNAAGTSTGRDGLYYSFNGIDYTMLNFSSVDTFKIYNVFEYDGAIAMIYTCIENSKTVQKLAIAMTPKELETAINSAIYVSIDYTMQNDSDLYKDDYAYLGCSGGIIIKANLDYTDTTRPDITLLKTLSAKQALVESKRYTDEKFAALEARVAALEAK